MENSDSESSVSDGKEELLEPELILIKEEPLNLLPDKSKKQYVTVYNEFNSWRSTKQISSFSEETFQIYFKEQAQKLAPPTLWARFSILKATIKTFDNIDIGNYKKVLSFLKRKMIGYKKKKSKVFSADEITKFCNEALDEFYLEKKVILIVGICGGCRKAELANITIDDVEDHNTMLLIKTTKNNIERTFTIRDEFYSICKKYMQLRPPGLQINRFFLQYHKGKCLRQPIGLNTIGSVPKQIATFLCLPEPELYTSHSFKRTSTTLLSDSRGNVSTLKRDCGWISNAPQLPIESHTEEPINKQMRINEQVTTSMSNNSFDSNSYYEIRSSKPPTTQLPSEIYHVIPSTSTDNSLVNTQTPEYTITSEEITSILSGKPPTKRTPNFDVDPLANTVSESETSTSKRTKSSNSANAGQSNSSNSNYSKATFNFNNCNVTINVYHNKPL